MCVAVQRQAGGSRSQQKLRRRSCGRTCIHLPLLLTGALNLYFCVALGKLTHKMVAKSKVLTFLEAAITYFYACDTMGLVPGTEDPMEKYWGIKGLYGSFAPTKHTL